MYYDSINGIVTIPVFDIDNIHIQRYFEWICDISHIIFLDMVPRYLCGFCFGSRWTWRLLCELVPTVGDRGILYLNMASLMRKINQRILGFPILIHSHIRCHTCHAQVEDTQDGRGKCLVTLRPLQPGGPTIQSRQYPHLKMGVTENWGIPWYTPIDPIAILIWKMISIGLGDSPLKPIDKARWFLLISPSPMDYVIYQSHNFFWSIMAKSMENDIPPFSNLPRLVFQVSWSFPRSHFFCVHRAGRSEGAELSCAAVKLR